MNFRPTLTLVVLILLVTFTATRSVMADSDTSSSDEYPQKLQYAGSVVLDGLIARPFGLATTGIGCGVFVAGLPFSIWDSESTYKTFKWFIGEPVSFTFTRSWGRFHRGINPVLPPWIGAAFVVGLAELYIPTGEI